MDLVPAGGMDGLDDQSRVLLDLAERLERVGAPWMLTGSLAAALHGEPRMTRDIDVVVEFGSLPSDAFRGAFADAYYVPEQGLQEALRHGAPLSTLHLDTGVKVDFIPRRDSEFHRTEFARRAQVALFGGHAWVVSAEDLVVAKLIWAAETESETQLRDIRGVLANPHDRAYIESWVQRLELEPDMAGRDEIREIADTSPEMLRRWREMLRARAPQERLRMATGMFELAKRLVRASLPVETPEQVFRRHLVRRLYPGWRQEDLPPSLRLVEVDVAVVREASPTPFGE